MPVDSSRPSQQKEDDASGRAALAAFLMLAMQAKKDAELKQVAEKSNKFGEFRKRHPYLPVLFRSTAPRGDGGNNHGSDLDFLLGRFAFIIIQPDPEKTWVFE